MCAISDGWYTSCVTCQIRLVVNGVHDSREAGGEEGRVADESETLGAFVNSAYALGYRYASAHAEAGVAHVEGFRVAKSVAADVAAEDRLLALHSLLYGVKGSAVRAAGAKHRRPYWKRRSVLLFVLLFGFPLQEVREQRFYFLRRVLAGGFHRAVKLAFDLYFNAVLSANHEKLSFQNGVEFLQNEDFIKI